MRLGKERPEIAAGNEILAHKIALKPNQAQAEYFAKAVGTARFAYNWGLDEWTCQYALAKDDVGTPMPNWMELNSMLNCIKAEDYPWMREVTKHATEHALANLGKAFDNYFSGKSKYPTFHKKYRNDSFYLHHNDIKLDGRHIKIPKLGWVKMAERLRFDGKITSATVSRIANKWFVSIAVEMKKREIEPRPTNEIGIDFGITSLMTLSDGTKIEGVKSNKKLEAKIRRTQKRCPANRRQPNAN